MGIAFAFSQTAACTGDLGGLADEDGPEVTTSGDLSCDPSLIPDALPLRRLSRVQYENTIRDVVTQVAPDAAAAILADVEPLVDRYPDDLAKGPDGPFGAFDRLDQTVHQEHIDAVYDVAVALGEHLTTGAQLGNIVGSCATDGDAGNDIACLEELIRWFGPIAQRRPMLDEDVVFYRDAIGSGPLEAADYGDAIALLLNSPYAFYMIEHGTEETERPDVFALDAYEIASRLSYHFWQTMPDAELLAAAESGDLLTEAGYAAQVERVYQDPRTVAAIESFYRSWLHREDLDELDSRLGTPVFDAFIGDFTPGPDLREHMFEELAKMGRYYSHTTDGTFEDILTSRASFAEDADLAALYGAPVWDGGEPPELSDPARVGLLTRAAMLATGSASTRPIMKGVFIRKALLCGEIPAPPANAAANPPELSDNLSTREVVEELTEQPGSACAGCHQTFINPLGFATENFDALGRVRSEQTLYDPDTGEVVGSAPIDTESVPQITLGDEALSTGAEDLTDLILESGAAHSCFARVYFRYTFGRVEDLDKDGCALVALREKLMEGVPLAEVLREVALTQDFQQRLFDEQ